MNSKEGKKGRKEGRLGAFFQIKKKLDLGWELLLKSKASFTQGVKAKVQLLKSNIPIDGKVEMSPKGFTLGVKAELEIFFFNLPQFTNKCWTFMALYWAQG